MRGWLLIFGIVGALLAAVFGILRIFGNSKKDNVHDSPVAVSTFSEKPVVVSSEPLSSPFIPCESFYSKSGVILGASGGGYVFHGPPDYVEGKILFYHVSRGTLI